MRATGRRRVAPQHSAAWRRWLGRACGLLASAATVGCGPPPGTAGPEAPTAPEPSAEPARAAPAEPGAPTQPEPTPADPAAEREAEATSNASGSTLPADACARDPAAEAPVRSDELGAGDRLVRILNASRDELQVRLLGADERPFVAGTLRILPGSQASFHVPAGTYRLRYRVQSTCEVLRGSKIVLTGHRAGVEISLRPGARQTEAGVSLVEEDL